MYGPLRVSERRGRGCLRRCPHRDRPLHRGCRPRRRGRRCGLGRRHPGERHQPGHSPSAGGHPGFLRCRPRHAAPGGYLPARPGGRFPEGEEVLGPAQPDPGRPGSVRRHPDQCPPKQLPGEPLRRCTGVLRTHRGLPGTGRIHPGDPAPNAGPGQRQAGQADPRHSISDESH